MEETKLGSYFQNLSTFQYDKAKEILDGERESLKATNGSLRQSIFTSLYTLIHLEKTYTSFVFLASKRFLKKENLKFGYVNLIVDLRKIETTVARDSDQFYVSLAAQMCRFARTRCLLIDFFETMLCLPQKVSSSFADVLQTLDCSIESLDDSGTDIAIMSTIFSLIRHEFSILRSLLQAQELISNLHFLEPLVMIHKATACLTDIGAIHASELSRSQHLFFTRGSQPNLIVWLGKLKSLLLAKYCLYFYDVLSKQAISGEDIRVPTGRDSIDLVGKLNRFQRSTNARLLCLIFDADQQDLPYPGHGYFLPNHQVERPTGLDSFPRIFTCPQQNTCRGDVSAIVMHISGKLNLGSPSEWSRTVYAQDDKLGRTYFVRKMEARVFLALVYDGRKPERDKTIAKFLTDIARVLRGFEVLAALVSS